MIITIDAIREDLLQETYTTIIEKVCQKVATLYGLPEGSEISILLCDNEHIHGLNKEYRNIDRPTDVLSFALNEGDEEMGEEEQLLLGDIVISLERTAEQAEEYGHSFTRELAYLTTHGMLHILGYDHMTEEDKKEMRHEEEIILQELGIVREGETL